LVRRLLVTLVLVLACPAAAQAAAVSVHDGVLSYTGAPGKVSNATFTEGPAGVVTITRGDMDDDALVAGSDCSAGPGTGATCSGVTSAVIDAGDMSDRITATQGITPLLTSIPATISGGEGNDAISGGAQNDTIDGGPGDDDLDGSSGDDSLRGGDGDDILRPNTGRDAITGDEGIDTVVYGLRVAPTFTLDALPNDGDAGENDLIGADVENVSAAASGDGLTTIVGDGGPNRLTVMGGRGDITGGDGADILEGGPLDDVIHARDGSPDTVLCNGGTDTVEADTLDSVSPSCEIVLRAAVPGGAFDDRPPLLSWASPVPGAALSANAPTVLSVNASDDRGVARVQFYDDDRLLCDATAPPYQCPYSPRGADVGRDTLLAVAIDGANQTTTAVRAITVRRFSSSGLSLSLKPSRDRHRPYSFRASGRLSRPTAVTTAEGCSGKVTLSAKRGKKTVYTRHASLSHSCSYHVTLHPGKRKGKLRLSARFGGNEVIAHRSSKTRTIRLG
jgi:hypothetical protein